MANVFKKLGGVFATIAPTIATMAGGPLAGSAVGALIKGLGLPEGTSPDQIEEHIIKSTDPDVYAKIKSADQQYALQLQQIGIDAEKVAQADRASAREREVAVKDKTPRNIAYISIAMFWVYATASLLLYLWGAKFLPEALLTVVVGFVSTVLGYAISENKQVYTYYFGSSAGSAEKTEIIGKSLVQ